MPFVPDSPAASSEPLSPMQKRMGFGRTPTPPDEYPVVDFFEKVGNIPYEVGGVVTDKTGSPVAGTAANLGINAVQMLIGGNVGGAGGKAIGKGMQSAARPLMQSAIKPTAADLVAGKADRAMATALDRGFIPNREGIAKLRQEIDGLMRQVEETLSRNASKSIDQNAIMDGLKPVFERFKNSIEEATRHGDIQKAMNDFMNHPWIKAITRKPEQQIESKILDASGKPITKTIPASGTGHIPVQEAQSIKQGIYRDIGNKAYGPQAIPAAEQEARKGIASALRTGIEREVPEVMPLNKQAGDLINLGNVSTRRAMMDANKNPLGLGLLAHNPLTFAAFEAERSPIIKAHLANWLHKNAAYGTPLGGAMGAIGTGAYNLPREDDE